MHVNICDDCLFLLLRPAFCPLVHLVREPAPERPTRFRRGQLAVDSLQTRQGHDHIAIGVVESGGLLEVHPVVWVSARRKPDESCVACGVSYISCEL